MKYFHESCGATTSHRAFIEYKSHRSTANNQCYYAVFLLYYIFLVVVFYYKTLMIINKTIQFLEVFRLYNNFMLT